MNIEKQQYDLALSYAGEEENIAQGVYGFLNENKLILGSSLRQKKNMKSEEKMERNYLNGLNCGKTGNCHSF